MKLEKIAANNKIRIINIVVLVVIFLVLALVPACKSGDEKVSSEKLSSLIEKIDSEVKVSGEKVQEFEILEREDFENLSPNDILEIISMDYQYSVQETSSSDESTLVVDFIDGRRAMITRFSTLGKIESFYLQFQSSLYDQGYVFEDRLRYSDLCTSFINENNSTKAYLLKRYNYFIILVKKTS